MKKSLALLALGVFAVYSFARSGMVPIGTYLKSAHTGSLTLPSTKLDHFYFPAKASISLNSKWSKGVTVNTSTSKTGGGSGGGVSQFALSINDNSNQNIFAYLRGQNNAAWQTACELSATSSGVNYLTTCVSTNVTNSPVGLPYNLYLARSSFSNESSFEQSVPYQCTSNISGLANVNTKHVISFIQPIAYEVTVTSDSCTINKA